MLLSIAVMLISGMLLGWICKKMHLPALLGMIFTGMLLGPYALDYIDGSILSISAELRKIALIIILARAGLSLDVADLKKVGRRRNISLVSSRFWSTVLGIPRISQIKEETARFRL